jgi:hypothetical protein
MNLSNEDAALFFKLMWAVQFYINNRLKISPDVTSVETYVKLPQEEKFKVRTALYENIDLLDAYISENPAGLSPDELQIVANWKRFVVDDFYILKFLKRHAIFVSANRSDVFGVLGLYDALEDIFFGRRPPILVKAILLPFKGRIVYDGLLSSYSVYFGSGIRGSVNEAYQRAKQNDRIITTLEPEIAATQKRKPKKPAPDWRPVLDEVVKTTAKLRQADTVIQTKAYGLLKASAKMAQATAHNPDDLDELYKLAKKTDRALNQLWTALERAE